MPRPQGVTPEADDKAGNPTTSKQASDDGGRSARTLQPRSDTRERLLLAAIEMFGSRGFKSTTMRDLASEVGIKAPAAYNHFASKEEILKEAVIWALHDFNRVVTHADDPKEAPIERLEKLVTRHVLYQLEHARVAKANDALLDSDILDRIGDMRARNQVRALMREHLDVLTEVILAILRGLGSDLDPRLCALAIGSMCDRVLRWYRPSGQYSPEKIARTYWQLAQNMLGLGSAST